MATQSLEQYLERKRILERSNPRSSPSEYPSFRSSSRDRQRDQPSREAASYEPITQEARIPNLISFWHRYRMNPVDELPGSMEALRQELLELEKNFGVVLLNPSVVHSAMLANKHYMRAQKLWQRSNVQSLSNAQSHADEALLNQLRSLLESYRTVAAYRIVSAREYIEARRFFTRPPQLLHLHEEARTYFKEARFHQDSREFNDADHFNRARLLFRKAILITEEIYLT